MARPGKERKTEQAGARRSVVPDAARHSCWLAAIWTGLGVAVASALIAIVAVAVCWLPVSGTAGRTTSAIRAGLLTFLASVHGGITVNGVSVAWLPLGMLVVVGAIAWRAGSGLGDVTRSLDERDPMRLALVGAAQAATFTVVCLLAVPFATLGTSRAPFFGVAIGATTLFTLTGGIAFVRSSALREWLGQRIPSWVGACLRGGAAAVTVYLAAGALLVAGSLVVHHRSVEILTSHVGGGWGGVPVLLLGVLAAPNAAIAASAYLAGPGFALGTGTRVSLFATAHGTVPAFPLLGALPTGAGGNPVDWGMAAASAVLAGVAVARLALRADRWWARVGHAVGAALTGGLLMLVLGWQAGGALGDHRLSTVGPSPLLLGGAVAATLTVTSLLLVGVILALRAAWRALGIAEDDDDGESFADFIAPKRAPRLVVWPKADDADEHEDGEDGEDGELAG